MTSQKLSVTIVLLWAATIGAIVVTAWMLLPTWREYRATQALLAAVDQGEIDRTLRESIDKAKGFDGGIGAVCQLSERLTDEDPDVRLRATLALALLEQNNEAAITALVDALERTEPVNVCSPRLVAARVLIEIGDLARPAVVELTAKY